MNFVYVISLVIGLISPMAWASKNSVFETIKNNSLKPEEKIELQKDWYQGNKNLVESEGSSFFVKERIGLMERQPCDQCHQGVSPGSLPIKDKTTRRAHWDIDLKHPTIAKNCNLCHEISGELQTINKEPVAFNHSYRVCAQCHSSQFADWKGGAHGKRLGGWSGPRIVENCTGCHDPHAPKFEVRPPATYATQPVR